ncbi:hypothetical protein QYM36_006986, partial [Artemia franciscana]
CTAVRNIEADVACILKQLKSVLVARWKVTWIHSPFGDCRLAGSTVPTNQLTKSKFL